MVGQINRGSQLGEVIYDMCNQNDIKNIVEIGTWNGMGSTKCIYESIVNNSHDSLQVLCSQLNIIETYMLMQQQIGGNNKNNFTGQHVELKPAGKTEGIKMINQLLHHMKIKSSKISIPTKFSLSQNYPNPFNPTTKINYALPTSTKVNIKIYDILGRMVKQLVNETKDAGYYTVTFDGTNLASGIYFYRIEAGNFVESKKMVIVK